MLFIATLHGSAAAQEGQTYVVQEGDTLAKIALMSVGDALRAEELFFANEDALDQAGGVEVGMVLVLPREWPQPRIENAKLPERQPVQGGDRDGVSSDDTLYTPEDAPPPLFWDRMAYFPALREIERDFEILMLRAAYEGDIGWGETKVESNRETRRDQLKKQILQAEVEFDKSKSEADECEARAERARNLLRSQDRTDTDEYRAQMTDAQNALSAAVWEEQQLWEGKLRPYLSEAARDTWDDYAAALTRPANEWDWVEVIQRHNDLDAYRVGIKGVEILPDEREAFEGREVDTHLSEIQSLRTDKRYLSAVHTSKRMLEAMMDLQDRDSCVRQFYDAKDFLEEKRRKLISLQIGSGIGSGDALTVDAARLAARFAGLISEISLVESFQTNQMWTSLWWKAGVADRLSGNHDLGIRRLAQAAAVAEESRLPEGEIPPSLDSWLRGAENEILRTEPGDVHILVPPLSKLTINGTEVQHTFGEADITLPPGIHRFVFWVDDSDPIMRLVTVVTDGDHDFVWYKDSKLGGEEDEIMGEVPTLPVLPKGPQTKRWHMGVSARGGLALGRPGFGVDATVRYLPLWIGGELGLSVLVPLEAYWLRAREEMYLFGRIHGGVDLRARVNRFSITGTVGGYMDPLLGAGPHGKVEFAFEALRDEKLRVSLDVAGGYDVTKHMEGVPPYVLSGGLGFWF